MALEGYFTGSLINLETKTENPPPQEGDPEPSASHSITALYGLLDDQAPAIVWAEKWAKWVYKGDIPLSQFESLEAYLEEFPYEVEVTEEVVIVTDPGFGNGAIQWMFRGFKQDNGQWIAALTETDAHHESSECKLWIGQWQDGEWLDLTDFALPAIERADFFGAAADPQILEDFELVSLQFLLPTSGNILRIQAMPNAAFLCRDGKVLNEEVPEDAADLICKAWDQFRPAPIECTFEAREGKFLLKGRQAN